VASTARMPTMNVRSVIDMNKPPTTLQQISALEQERATLLAKATGVLTLSAAERQRLKDIRSEIDRLWVQRRAEQFAGDRTDWRRSTERQRP
jgi:hypothetical protein